MRYLTAACPAAWRVLLVESGARPVLEAALPRLRSVLDRGASFDLVTCYAGVPSSLDAAARVWRTQDYRERAGRGQLIGELQALQPTVLAIVCSGEPIMLRWKWWLAIKLPAKVLIVNENADFFWLDTTNLRLIRRLAMVRLGLSGNLASPALARLLLLPFSIAYLLFYATIVHARRAARIAFGSRPANRSRQI